MMRSRNPKYGLTSIAPYGRNHPDFQAYLEEYEDFYGENPGDDVISDALLMDDNARAGSIQKQFGDDAGILREPIGPAAPNEVPTFQAEREATSLFEQRTGRPPSTPDDHNMVRQLMQSILQMPNFREEGL